MADMEGVVFDSAFYQAMLPDAVKQQCQTVPGQVPVVELHLADGTTLDLCHIVALAPTWLAVVYFHNPAEGDEVEQAFLPYRLVQWITLSAHPSHVRHIGFDVERSVAATQRALVAPEASAPGAASESAEDRAAPRLTAQGDRNEVRTESTTP
jgi:hypothetical protein